MGKKSYGGNAFSLFGKFGNKLSIILFCAFCFSGNIMAQSTKIVKNGDNFVESTFQSETEVVQYLKLESSNLTYTLKTGEVKKIYNKYNAKKTKKTLGIVAEKKDGSFYFRTLKLPTE